MSLFGVCSRLALQYFIFHQNFSKNNFVPSVSDNKLFMISFIHLFILLSYSAKANCVTAVWMAVKFKKMLKLISNLNEDTLSRINAVSKEINRSPSRKDSRIDYECERQPAIKVRILNFLLNFIYIAFFFYTQHS